MLHIACILLHEHAVCFNASTLENLNSGTELQIEKVIYPWLLRKRCACKMCIFIFISF